MLNMKIMRKKSDIQQEALPFLMQIVDLLTGRAVIRKNIKSMILARNTPEEKFDLLISNILDSGQHGCESFLGVLKTVGLGNLAEKIKNDTDSSPKLPQSLEDRLIKVERYQDKLQCDIDELKQQHVENTQTIEALQKENAELRKINSGLVEEIRHFDAKFKEIQEEVKSARNKYERELEANGKLRDTNRRLLEQIGRYRGTPKR